MESTIAKKCKVQCEMADCSYNINRYCHAISITVGDQGQAICGTFCLSAIRGGRESIVACVGACKVEDCIHNSGLLCRRNHITIGCRDEDFYCLSYKARQKALLA
jgi:hypothetical protein